MGLFKMREGFDRKKFSESTKKMVAGFQDNKIKKEEYEKRLSARIGWKISTLLRYRVKDILERLPELMWDDLPDDDEGWKDYMTRQSRVDVKNIERHRVLRMQREAEMPLNASMSMFEARDKIRHELVKVRIERMNYQALLDEIKEMRDEDSWKGDKKEKGKDKRDLV